jgi:hypothetical protein
VASAALGFVSYASYPSNASERSVKIAASVILLYVVINPVLAFAGELNAEGIEDYFEGIYDGFDIEDSQMGEISEEAFAEGIKNLLQREFGAEKDCVRVSVFGFDFKNMKAENIKIVLSGKSAFLDWRRIENYITESGLGECEVSVSFE